MQKLWDKKVQYHRVLKAYAAWPLTISPHGAEILKPMCGCLALSMVLKHSVVALSLPLSCGALSVVLKHSCTIHTFNLLSPLSSIMFVISFSATFSDTDIMSYIIYNIFMLRYVEVKGAGDVSEDTCSLESGIKMDLLNHY